jgi:hypothetical protein
MRSEHTTDLVDRARVAARLSRRSFLHIAAAGTAAALPTAAIAAAGESSQLPLSNEEQLDACVTELKSILSRMHSTVTEQHHFLSSRPDGSYHLTFQGYVAFQTFDGPGFYEISMDGYPFRVWLEKHTCRRALDGKPMPGFDYYTTHRLIDGELTEGDRRMGSVNIIRKLPEVAVQKGEEHES